MPTRTRQSRTTRCLGWLAVALVALTGTLHARTFTSTDGRTLEADVVKIEGEAAVLQLATGRSVTVPFNLLIESDQAYLKKGAKPLHRTGLSLRKPPRQPGAEELRNMGRKFPPNHLHESWMDFLYWDAELEA